MEGTLTQMELVRPWRRATLFAATVAAVELALLVVCAVALLGNPVAGALHSVAAERAAALPDPVKPKPTPLAAPKLTRARTTVMVLNGNGRAGAASAESDRLRGLGYAIGPVGNAPRSDYASSIVLYRPGFRPEAARLAKDLRVRSVAPLDGMRPAELQGAQVALILGG